MGTVSDDDGVFRRLQRISVTIQRTLHARFITRRLSELIAIQRRFLRLPSVVKGIKMITTIAGLITTLNLHTSALNTCRNLSSQASIDGVGFSI